MVSDNPSLENNEDSSDDEELPTQKVKTKEKKKNVSRNDNVKHTEKRSRSHLIDSEMELMQGMRSIVDGRLEKKAASLVTSNDEQFWGK